MLWISSVRGDFIRRASTYWARGLHLMAMTRSVEERLSNFLVTLSRAKALRSGHIALHFTGDQQEHYFIATEAAKAVLTREPPANVRHFEMIGDRDRILAVLEGTKDAGVQFATGAFRIRGNLTYMRTLAAELGLLKTRGVAAGAIPFVTSRARGAGGKQHD